MKLVSGTTANRISLHRNLVTLTYQDIFSGGATITMYARHWSGSYTGWVYHGFF